MGLQYNKIPTLSQWMRDSSVALAIRKKDIVLDRIDTLLSLYHDRPSATASVIACDLFFTLDYWLRSYKTNKMMETGRLAAIQALYSAVAFTLCRLLHCTINSLPRELELMFGREMSDLGIITDQNESRAQYLERKEIQKYRLRFRGGLVYRYTWMDNPSGPMRLVPVNTSDYYNVGKEKKNTIAGWGSFVMTMGREMYMAKHALGSYGGNNGIFHSSYLAGEAVSCAGSMLVENGKIRKIRSDSGHYKPTDTNMLALLQAFQMLAIPLKDMKVVSFDGKTEVNAPDFFRASAKWDLLLANANSTYSDNQSADLLKSKPDLNKVPDLRNVWVKPIVTKPLEQWISEVGGGR